MLRELTARLTSLSSDRLSGALLFLLAAFILWQNLSYPVGTLSEPGAGFLPLILGLALALVGVLIAWFGGKATSLKAIGWGEAPRALLILAACSVAALAFEPLGYRLTLIALLVFLLGVLERKPVINVLLTAIGFALISYYVFFDLLDVQLPRSPWGF
jgi:putative tricarboxylic transport membrane protein